jgi:LmbE family N-acetylglucosaminyl deacetylase/SAM-dependent methyltransferase
VVSFDHRDPGTDPDDWTVFLEGLDAPGLDPTTFGSVIVVSPHPDDETLAAGGLIARAADAGVPVRLVLVTEGEGSHLDSPTVSPSRMAALRETETIAAMYSLHAAITTTRLGIPDGGLREHRDALTSGLAEVLDAVPSPVLLVAPWSGDGHRDHRIAGEVAAELAGRHDEVTLAEYPIWLWHWGSPGSDGAPWDRARAVHVSPEVRERRSRALDAYRSQLEPLSDAAGDEAIVDARHRRHFERAVELFFVREPGTATAGDADASRSRESFDAHYARKPGGWDFEGSWYEQRKRAVTVSALPRARFRSALELGCATGVLTRAIAERADSVLGIDIAEAPLAAARATAPAATFARMTVPDEWPTGSFELIVLSEIGYYLSPTDLDRTIDRMAASLDEDGVLLACHWRHPDTEAVSSGDAVHARLRERWPRAATVTHVEEDFVLEVFPGPAAASVAHETGLVR